MAVRRAGEEEVAAGVGTNFLDDLRQRHDVTGPFLQADKLVAALERHHLMHDDDQPGRLHAQRFGRCSSSAARAPDDLRPRCQ